MKPEIVHIGVDVSKEKLDVYDPTTKESFPVPNDIKGFRKLRDLARRRKAVVCCEPTGGHELDLTLFLQKSGVQVAYCDGYRVRHYALSTGQFSKNDKVDARMISAFADNTPVRVLGAKDRVQLELGSRWKLYQTFVDMHVVLSQKASSEHDPAIRKALEAEAKRLRRLAEDVVAKCVALVSGDERMADLFARFTLVGGIGAKTALDILAELPEIGTVSDGAIAKLVGVAPMDNQSGKTDRLKHIRGGRRGARNALYMAAVAAIRHNHVLGPYYWEVKKRMPTKKASKWAIVPVMRKLLHLLNRIARDPDFKPQAKPAAKVG